jgi:hypothetical protein
MFEADLVVEVGEVVTLETTLELRYPNEDTAVIVVVNQLVIATWHCCTEDVFDKV